MVMIEGEFNKNLPPVSRSIFHCCLRTLSTLLFCSLSLSSVGGTHFHGLSSRRHYTKPNVPNCSLNWEHIASKCRHQRSKVVRVKCITPPVSFGGFLVRVGSVLWGGTWFVIVPGLPAAVAASLKPRLLLFPNHSVVVRLFLRGDGREISCRFHSGIVRGK